MSEPYVRLRRDVPEDLHSIVAWLDQYSPAVSDHFVDAVFAALDDLTATVHGARDLRTLLLKRL